MAETQSESCVETPLYTVTYLEIFLFTYLVAYLLIFLNLCYSMRMAYIPLVKSGRISGIAPKYVEGAIRC